ERRRQDGHGEDARAGIGRLPQVAYRTLARNPRRVEAPQARRDLILPWLAVPARFSWLGRAARRPLTLFQGEQRWQKEPSPATTPPSPGGPASASSRRRRGSATRTFTRTAATWPRSRPWSTRRWRTCSAAASWATRAPKSCATWPAGRRR